MFKIFQTRCQNEFPVIPIMGANVKCKAETSNKNRKEKNPESKAY